MNELKPLKEYIDYRGIPVCRLYTAGGLVSLTYYDDNGIIIMSQLKPSVPEADYEAQECLALRNRKISTVDPVVNKAKVVEQLNKAIEEIVVFHMQALWVRHGDIMPEQQMALDTYVAAVAEIIVQVVEQNRD